MELLTREQLDALAQFDTPHHLQRHRGLRRPEPD